MTHRQAHEMIGILWLIYGALALIFLMLLVIASRQK